MLKYEGLAAVGDRIRAYDFPGNTSCYVEGTVLRVDKDGRERGFAAFVIMTERDATATPVPASWSRVGLITHVPMEVAFMEYDGRVVKLGGA